ncbi:MAG: inositol monophosphatase family protein [Gemmatimonadota bacterium]
MPNPASAASLRRLLHGALEVARLGAAVHEGYWKGAVADGLLLEVREKGVSDFVTAVDLEAEEVMVSYLRRYFPRHGILAEEGGGDAEAMTSHGQPLWVIDPLDGTTNFLHGHPAFAASVGVVVNGEPVVGAVVAAATGDAWWAGRGLGAFHNHRPIRTSRVTGLKEALVGTGFPFKRLDELPNFLDELSRVLPATSGIRRNGAAAVDLCFLAQGSLDAFWEGYLAPWDWAGGLAILQEAGGAWDSVEGGEFDLLQGGSLLAANSPQMLETLREKLRGASPEG